MILSPSQDGSRLISHDSSDETLGAYSDFEFLRTGSAKVRLAHEKRCLDIVNSLPKMPPLSETSSIRDSLSRLVRPRTENNYNYFSLGKTRLVSTSMPRLPLLCSQSSDNMQSQSISSSDNSLDQTNGRVFDVPGASVSPNNS